MYHFCAQSDARLCEFRVHLRRCFKSRSWLETSCSKSGGSSRSCRSYVVCRSSLLQQCYYFPLQSGQCWMRPLLVRKLLHFYPGHALHSVVYAVVRCVSLRLSVCHTPVLCVDYTAKPILKLFRPSVSLIILVFPHQRSIEFWTGFSVTGRQIREGGGENCESAPILRCISETTPDRAIVTIERLYNGTIFDDLEWPLTRV